MRNDAESRERTHTSNATVDVHAIEGEKFRILRESTQRRRRRKSSRNTTCRVAQRMCAVVKFSRHAQNEASSLKTTQNARATIFLRVTMTQFVNKHKLLFKDTPTLRKIYKT